MKFRFGKKSRAAAGTFSSSSADAAAATSSSSSPAITEGTQNRKSRIISSSSPFDEAERNEKESPLLERVVKSAVKVKSEKKQRKRRQSLRKMDVPNKQATTSSGLLGSTTPQEEEEEEVVEEEAPFSVLEVKKSYHYARQMSSSVTCSATSATTNRSSFLNSWNNSYLLDDNSNNNNNNNSLNHHRYNNSFRDGMTVTSAATTVASSAVSSQHDAQYLQCHCNNDGYDNNNNNNDNNIKEHDFQLIPNDQRELGMVQSDFSSISEAMAAQHHLIGYIIPQQSPQETTTTHSKPILVIDVEVPGNTYLGKTLFSHPLILEAMESYFITVACSHQTLPPTSSTTAACTSGASHSKMGGNYSYTRVRILDPLTGLDLVPCLDRHLGRATLLQAMLDSIAMLSPQQRFPKYLTNLLEEEQAADRAGALSSRCRDLMTYHHHHNYHHQQQPRHHHQHQHYYNGPIPMHGLPVTQTDVVQEVPMAVFGLEHTALGEVVFAGLYGVLSTQSAWVMERITPYNEHIITPKRQAVVLVRYDSQKLSYAGLVKYAIDQHAQTNNFGTPSNLKLYYESHEQQMAAQVHVRAHYRDHLEQVDPNNPAQHLYASFSTQKTIPILPLQRQDEDDDDYPNSSCSSTSASSNEYEGVSKTRRPHGIGHHGKPNTTVNNSLNNVHPGYKVPDYDDVVEHAAAKAAAEAAAKQQQQGAPKVKYTLKTMSPEMLELQYSKPALRESHLRFVPLTPQQATLCNRLVFEGKFHLAMQLLSPRQGMVLMQALRHGAAKQRRPQKPQQQQVAVVSHTPNQEVPPLIRNATTPVQRTANSKNQKNDSSNPGLRRATTLPATPPKTATTAAGKGTKPSRRRASEQPRKPHFPKQAPRRISVSAVPTQAAASVLQQELSEEEVEKRQQQKSSPAPTSTTTPVTMSYRDVVDVPIVEAWKAFVVFQEGNSDDDDDDSLLSLEDVYSERMTMLGMSTSDEENDGDDASTICSNSY